MSRRCNSTQGVVRMVVGVTALSALRAGIALTNRRRCDHRYNAMMPHRASFTGRGCGVALILFTLLLGGCMFPTWFVTWMIIDHLYNNTQNEWSRTNRVVTEAVVVRHYTQDSARSGEQED